MATASADLSGDDSNNACVAARRRSAATRTTNELAPQTIESKRARTTAFLHRQDKEAPKRYVANAISNATNRQLLRLLEVPEKCECCSRPMIQSSRFPISHVNDLMKFGTYNACDQKYDRAQNA